MILHVLRHSVDISVNFCGAYLTCVGVEMELQDEAAVHPWLASGRRAATLE